MSFLPAAPRSVSEVSINEAPSVPANPYLSESSTFLKPALQIPAKPSQSDLRIRHADERLASGKHYLSLGDTVSARAEFDAAIDLLLATPENVPDRHKVETHLEKLVAEIHKMDVNRLGGGDLSGTLSYDKAPLEDILDMTFPVDPSLKPRVREQVGATVSQLPLQINDAVLSYIKYFSGEKGHKTLVAGLRRAGRYRELISRILKEEGVPQELIYLAQAESGFLPRAVSNKAAVGMWQFVQFRGRQYGLMQSPYSDDRLDPEKATRSAARHLRDLYAKFGDWYLAIAGYNCGDGCVERAVQRTGYADFWEIRSRNAIPHETTNYVPIILAFTIMHKNAKEYGLENIEPEPSLQYETIQAQSATHLALIADAADRPVSEIRELNPSLISTVAPPGFDVHVPSGTKTQILAGIEAIPQERRASWRIHRVAEGDTLNSIARRYNMPATAIAAANNSTEAELGEVLVIPTVSQIERATRSTSQRGIKPRGIKTGLVAAQSTSQGRSAASKTGLVRNARTSKRVASGSKPAHRRVAQNTLQASR